MTTDRKRILCHAFVAPGEVIVNAIVTYCPDEMLLIDAVAFERETASTTRFDGIVVNGLPINDFELKISADGFREQLARIADNLHPADSIILLPLSH